jgi:hypothetical protein
MMKKQKQEEEHSCFSNNQNVQNALDNSIIIDAKHWLDPQDMRALLAKIGADYDKICKYLADSSSIRDGFFLCWLCLEDCLALVEKMHKLEMGKGASLRLPYRMDKKANGYVSTMNHEG